MKKLILGLTAIFLLMLPSTSQAADYKVSELSAITTLGNSDLMRVAYYSGGLYYSRKITVANLKTVFQPLLTYPVTGPETPTAGYLTKWDASGRVVVDGPKLGTLTDAHWCKYTTAGGLACTEDTPSGGSATSTIAASGLTADKVYYMATGGLTLADASASTKVPGICIASAADACQFSGEYTMSASPTWTVGGLIYVSAASAGALTQTIPSTSGNQVSVVGVATAADKILIMPSLVVVQVP